MCLYFLKSTFNKGVQGYGYKINVQNQEHSYTTKEQIRTCSKHNLFHDNNL